LNILEAGALLIFIVFFKLINSLQH